MDVMVVTSVQPDDHVPEVHMNAKKKGVFEADLAPRDVKGNHSIGLIGLEMVLCGKKGFPIVHSFFRQKKTIIKAKAKIQREPTIFFFCAFIRGLASYVGSVGGVHASTTTVFFFPFYPSFINPPYNAVDISCSHRKR